MSITKLTVTIGEQEVAMTLVEAQRLYNDLHVLFGKPAYPQFQPQTYPTSAPVRPMQWGDGIRSGDLIGFSQNRNGLDVADSQTGLVS